MGPSYAQRLRPVWIVKRHTEESAAAIDITRCMHIFQQIGSAQSVFATEVMVELDTHPVLINRFDVRLGGGSEDRNRVVSENSRGVLSPGIEARAWVWERGRGSAVKGR